MKGSGPKGGLPRFVPNKPCAERASACQARACTGAEGFIHSEESVASQLFDWFYLPHFLLLQWVVVKYKGVRSPFRFKLVHTTRVSHRTVAGAGERR